jgi:cAMP-dependent protein kinase regulator
LDRDTFNTIVKEAAIKKREKYEAFLKSVDILKQMEPYELSQICDALVVKKVNAGDNIITQGDDGNDFYVVEEGEAYATKVFNEGEEAQVVLEYQKGSYFGELALLKGEPRAASVIAKTNCELLSLERKAFKRLLGPIEAILKRCSDSYTKFVK